MEEMPLIHKGPTEMTCEYIRLQYVHNLLKMLTQHKSVSADMRLVNS